MAKNKTDLKHVNEAGELLRDLKKQGAVFDKPTKFGSNDEYNFISIPGRRRQIVLLVPKRKPSQEELKDLHRCLAEIAIKTEMKRLLEEEKGELEV